MIEQKIGHENTRIMKCIIPRDNRLLQTLAVEAQLAIGDKKPYNRGKIFYELVLLLVWDLMELPRKH